MLTQASNDRIEILMVEDNPDDVMLTGELLKAAWPRTRLHFAEDGAEALTFLRREERYANVPRPDLIVLDLNLPKKDGREVLAEIKADDSLRRIPVIVLTTSQAPSDILRAYDLHANCYITKPRELDQYFEVVKCIEDFWLTTAKLPREAVA